MIEIRQAGMNDVEGLVKLEKEVWKDVGADEEKIVSRIETFSRGNIAALMNHSVVGYVSFEYVSDINKMGLFTWNMITDNGMILNTHDINGEFAFGVSLTVGMKAQRLNLGDALTFYGLSIVAEDNKMGTYLGSRMPGFAKYKKQNPGISAGEYIQLRWKGRPRDPELRLYEQVGFTICKLLPNFFPDSKSFNNGVLVYYPNNLYNHPEHKTEAEFMRSEALRIIKGGNGA